MMINSNAGGTEFAFWILLFAQILIAWAIHALFGLVLQLRRARRDIKRLTVERDRFHTWVFYRSEHGRQPSKTSGVPA